MARLRPSLDRDWQSAVTAAGLLGVLFPDHRTPPTPGVGRKLRLVLCGAARTVWHRLPHDDLRAAIQVAELFADDRAGRRELEVAQRAAARHQTAAAVEQSWRAIDAGYGPDPRAASVGPLAQAEYAAAAAGLVRAACQRSVTVARTAGRVLAEFPRLAAPLTAWQAGAMGGWHEVVTGPDPAAAVVRDVFGGPTPVRLKDDWKSPAAVAVAGGIVADADWSRLPVLADALEDAGCDSERVLAHCRGPGPHGRGCWVVDAVRGR